VRSGAPDILLFSGTKFNILYLQEFLPRLALVGKKRKSHAAVHLRREGKGKNKKGFV
jgi:hypothetical protein